MVTHEDVRAVRSDLEELKDAYRRCMALAQGIEDKVVAAAMERRRLLVIELLGYLESRDDLVDLQIMRGGLEEPFGGAA